MSHLSKHRIGSKFPRHAKIIAAQEMLPREFFEELYKFAFVRNPWDLQVSSYHHVRKEKPEAIAHIEDFTGFLDWKFCAKRPYQFHLDICSEPQVNYLRGLSGDFLTDFVGKYENLQEDLDLICDQIGVKRVELPHKRKAASRDRYRAYYSERDAALIGRIFAPDVEAFGYHY